MKLSELHQACREAVSTGRLGDIVALRILASAPQPSNAVTCVHPLWTICSGLLDSAPRLVSARGAAHGKTLTVLIEFQKGQTALLTSAAVEQGTNVQLLMIGNHGTARLQIEPDCWQAECEVTSDPRFDAVLRQSLDSGMPVEWEAVRQ